MIKFIEKDEDLLECIEYLNTLDEISLDCETEGFDCHTKDMLLLQVGSEAIQYVINTKEVSIYSLKNVLENKLILIHNASFDFRFLYKKGIDIKNIYDTFLTEAILTTGLLDDDRDLSLKGVAQKYCNVTLDKEIRGIIHKEGNSERVVQYAADDIKYLSEIKRKQLIEIDRWELNKVLDLENKVVRVFSLMEYNGIGFDFTKLNNVTTEINNLTISIIKQLDKIIVEESKVNSKLKHYTKVQFDLFSDVRDTFINWSSPAQKTKLLNQLGLKVDDVAEKTLQKIKSKHKLVNLLLDYSKYNKLANTFGKPLLAFINKSTGRIHPSIWQVLSTARISMSDPPLQQIPAHSKLGKEIKSCFVPKQGYKFVSADYSGIELRIIAHYSQDPLWLKTFNNNEDLHSILCAETFNISIDKVKEPFPDKPDISYRFLQKTINFGLNINLTVFNINYLHIK